MLAIYEGLPYNKTVMEASIRKNRRGTEPEGRLLLSLGWPIIVSMLVQAFYNIVDSVFVSRMGTLPEADLLHTPALRSEHSISQLLLRKFPLRLYMTSFQAGYVFPFQKKTLSTKGL